MWDELLDLMIVLIISTKKLSEQRTPVLRCCDRKSDKRAHCICDCALINHISTNPTGLTLNPENENNVNTPCCLLKLLLVEFLLIALFIILEMSRSHTYLVPFYYLITTRLYSPEATSSSYYIYHFCPGFSLACNCDSFVTI